MAQYAFAFDLDTTAMVAAGLTRSDITQVYQVELPAALAACGFTGHPQGSLYHTEAEQDPIASVMQLQTVLRNQAQTFCHYVRRVHIFRMEEWSDVTLLIANHVAAGPPNADEEVEQQVVLDSVR